MTLETVIRPFVGDPATPTPFQPAGGGSSAPPVRISVGVTGGQRTFAYSGSSSLSSYMAAVHTEKPSDAFDMTTGKLAG